MLGVPDLEARRHDYAERLRALVDVRSSAVVRAFATVPRERFLGAGPWSILVPDANGQVGYRITADTDPTHLYANVLVAIDADRGLNNGEPASWAAWIDVLDLPAAARVVHIGCGTGYYTAILAEVVGPRGTVLAIEVDLTLANRARANLAYLPRVTVVASSGSRLVLDAADAIVVNAGATHPTSSWLDGLSPGGRLLLPVTGSRGLDGIGSGGMFLITRRTEGYTAKCVSPVTIFPCIGVRDADCNRQLLAKTERDWPLVRSVRRDAHDVDDTCWLHGPEGCLSTADFREGGPEPVVPARTGRDH
jgi:protein-L-isoaspartate(D-aspartate) O-methyltransferase